MQFQCDRCGKRYSTGQEIREGRAYRFKCRACGHDVIVRGPQGLTGVVETPPPVRRNGNGAQAGAALIEPPARPLSETPPTISVVSPEDQGTPPGGYIEFRLDGDAVTTQSTITAALTDAGRELTPAPPSPFLVPPAHVPTPPPAPTAPLASPFLPEPALDPSVGEPTPGLSGEALVRAAAKEPVPSGRRRLLVALVAVVPAVLVVLLFGGLWESSPDPARAVGAAPGAAPAKTPGLLTPQIYVGPVTFESPVPRMEADAASPARPARPAAVPARPARREVATARKAAGSRAAGRGAETASAPAPAASTDAAARTAPDQPIEPEPEPEPEPQAAEPAPAPTSAPQTAAAPAPAAAPPPAQALATPVPLPPPPVAASASDEPVFAGAGYRRPAPVTPGCIERGVRIPQSLADRLPPSVMLRFAVGRDGSADLVQVLPGGDPGTGVRPIDAQLAQALTQAVRACRFTPGADEAGRLARLWVMMRVRFAE